MSRVLPLLPNLEADELVYVEGLAREMSDDRLRQFALVYASRRKEPQLILLTALLGFVVVAGVQRFIIGQIGMGLLYLFTGGLCFIGTIVDLVRHKRLAFEYNCGVAREVYALTAGVA
jgi:TM2 domain-containing membrane protein YozV